MAKRIYDAGMYHKLSEPFESTELCQSALDAFFDELYELRVKHKLADVSVIVQTSIRDSGTVMWSAHCGSDQEKETMAAWHFGQMQADRQDRVRKALEHAAAIKKEASRK